MPPRIDLNKCNGCGGKPETACEMVCPGDLMMLDPETGKALPGHRRMLGLHVLHQGLSHRCPADAHALPAGLLQGQPAPHHGQGLHHLEMP